MLAFLLVCFWSAFLRLHIRSGYSASTFLTVINTSYKKIPTRFELLFYSAIVHIIFGDHNIGALVHLLLDTHPFIPYVFTFLLFKCSNIFWVIESDDPGYLVVGRRFKEVNGYLAILASQSLTNSNSTYVEFNYSDSYQVYAQSLHRVSMPHSPPNNYTTIVKWSPSR